MSSEGEPRAAAGGSPPRVIQLCNFARPEAGAFVPMVHDLLRRALERGWSAAAVFTEDARGLDWIAGLERSGIDVRFAPGSSRIRQGLWLKRMLAEESGPTVLHSHFTTFDVPAVLAAGRRPQTAIIWHVHSTLMTRPASVIRNIAKFATFGRWVDALLCPAQNIADGVIRRRAPVDRVHFLPSAIDVASYPLQDAAARRRAREKLDLPAEATVLLHFGWHWYLKGGDSFLQTIERLCSEGHDDLLGLERGGAGVAEREVAVRGLEQVVRVVAPIADIRELFAAADVVVSSSRSEGMAYSVLEAICSGTPVVATQIPGHIYVGARVAACSVVRRDPALLAAAVQSFLDRDPALAAEAARESRDWIAGNLGLEVISNRLLDNYQAILRGYVPIRWS